MLISNIRINKFYSLLNDDLLTVNQEIKRKEKERERDRKVRNTQFIPARVLCQTSGVVELTFTLVFQLYIVTRISYFGQWQSGVTKTLCTNGPKEYNMTKPKERMKKKHTHFAFYAFLCNLLNCSLLLPTDAVLIKISSVNLTKSRVKWSLKK